MVKTGPAAHRSLRSKRSFRVAVGLLGDLLTYSESGKPVAYEGTFSVLGDHFAQFLSLAPTGSSNAYVKLAGMF